MQQPVPIPTLHLLPALDQHLITLLESLRPEDWAAQTLAPAWTVKDVAAHLLDGNIRSLSSSRDNFSEEPTTDVADFTQLVGYLNALNSDWVKAMKRVSPAILIALLKGTNKMYLEHLEALAPFDKAIFPVAWAGESESENWFHIAREYTEKWHHQQQIRHAIGGVSPLFETTFFKPYLDTSFMAIPWRLRHIRAETGDTFSIIISGQGGGEWHLEYVDNEWRFCAASPSYAVTRVYIDDQVIWRMLSKEITTEELMNRVTINGRKEVAEAFLGMTAVMV
jgi:uncharacterized protein (TIGR03083 family)